MKRMKRLISTLAMPATLTCPRGWVGPSIRKLLHFRKRTAALALGIFVFALGATWIAWAQVGVGGTVLGCVDSSGKIRAVDETTGSCRPGDTTLFWYTKVGAEAAFLSKTGKAVDSDKLDGLDSSAMVKNGDAAGGALTGAYPNPSIAPGAVGTNQIQNGTVTAEKFAASVPLGVFGDSAVLFGTEVKCGEPEPEDLTVPIIVTSPSRIYVSASATWIPETTAFSDLLVQGLLRDATDTTIVARTPTSGRVKIDLTVNNAVGSATTSGILFQNFGNQVFVATPGTYVLHLFAPLAGGCHEGDTKGLFSDRTLTYMLLRAQQ
jgi:hypothetical protein